VKTTGVSYHHGVVATFAFFSYAALSVKFYC